MHEHHVGVAAPRHVERLSGAERNDAHPDAGALLKIGRMKPNNPDCSVEVVEVTVMNFSWAWTGSASAAAAAIRDASKKRRGITTAVLL
jgi:hypothetical protein